MINDLNAYSIRDTIFSKIATGAISLVDNGFRIFFFKINFGFMTQISFVVVVLA